MKYDLLLQGEARAEAGAEVGAESFVHIRRQDDADDFVMCFLKLFAHKNNRRESCGTVDRCI